MAIKIGHASIDERGKVAGGKAGDQTKKEVCTRTWYNGEWDCVLRPKSPEVAEKSASFVEGTCANDNVGYGQDHRNTLYPKAVAVNYDVTKITTPCECDCSTLMHVAAMAGGARLTYGNNGHTTRTMRKAYKASGDYEVLTDSKYLTTDKYLMRGDTLVKEGEHTVMALENGELVDKSTDELPNIIYATETNGRWLPEVINHEDYAGLENREITGFMVRLSDDTTLKYRVHIIDDEKAGRWLPYVTGYDKNDYNNGYAGNGKVIDAIEIICEKYKIAYKVSSTANGQRYYSEVINDEDYAGVFGKPIDKVMCRVI